MTNLILDGNNIAFRANYIPRIPNNVNGLNVTPIDQFFTMILSYITKFKPNNTFITWDKRLNPNVQNFRKDLVKYKENRKRVNLDELFECIEIIIELTNTIGIKTIYPWNLEADDVIAYLAKNLNGSKIIVSSDKDLLQLIDDNVSIYNTTKNNIINKENFRSFTGIELPNFLLYKCILGDKSDNISGLPKYGEIKSKRLAETLGKTPDNLKLLNNEQIAILERNKKIMDLSIGLTQSEGEKESYEEQLKNEKFAEFNMEKFNEICYKYKLYGVLNKVGKLKQSISEKNILEKWFAE